MARTKLTDAAVQRLTAPCGQRKTYFDELLPGFALRVSGPTKTAPRGRKSFVLYYRFLGVQKLLTLEPGYPALGLADARERARAALLELGTAQDPRTAQAEREREAEAASLDTIEGVVDQFMIRYMQAQRRAPKYILETRRYFDAHVIPAWKGRPITTITRREVIKLLDAAADNNGPVSANRLLCAVSKLFNWALGRDLVENSPVARIPRPGAERRRDRVLSAEEVRLVWEAAGELGYPFGPFYRLCLVLARRRSEIAAMTWGELDFADPLGPLWTIPGSRTKSGRPILVPLSPLAVEILEATPRLGAHVFVAPVPLRPIGPQKDLDLDRPISGFSSSKTLLDREIARLLLIARKNSVPERWTTHDLRRTAASNMGRLGIPRFVIARVLDHADNSITGIYDRHDYLKEKSQALAAWGAYLSELLTPPQEGGGNVVPIKRRRKA